MVFGGCFGRVFSRRCNEGAAVAADGRVEMTKPPGGGFVIIASMWLEISSSFHVFGAKGVDWEDFQRGVNYDAFLVKMK